MTTPLNAFSNNVPILLLPPSEGKAVDDGPSRGRRTGTDTNGWDPGDGAFGDLMAQRLAVIEALGSTGGGSEKLLGVGGRHLLRAQSANTSLLRAATLPAWQRYTGVVWDHLDPATLGAVARRRIVVVSGLLGLVRGDDPVPDYRLRMSANLDPLGTLSTWWREDLTEALKRVSKRRVLIDLLPQEHSAALNWADLPPSTQGITVSLVDPSGRRGSHFAKAAKGELARAILSDGIGALESWHHDRFVVDVTPLGTR